MYAIGSALAIALSAIPLLLASPPGSERVTYKRNSDRDLMMTITKPAGWTDGDRRPALIFFFNGGWKEPEAARPQFEEQARYFAARGMVVAQADYREKSGGGVTSDKCVEDIFSAVRWLRAHAAQWGLDPARIAAAGGSGSIHLPAAVFQTDNICAPGEDAAISPLPGALFSFHPDPDVLEPAMMQRLLAGGDFPPGRRPPPTVVYWGSRDAVAPFLEEFVARARAAGLPVESHVGEGGLHGFYKFTPGLETTTAHMDQRLRELGFLAEQPRADLPHKAAPADYEPRILATQQQWLERHTQLMKQRNAGSVTAPFERPAPSSTEPSASPPPRRGDKTALEQKLDSLLRRYPEADANKDGLLTMAEAKAFRDISKTPQPSLGGDPAAARPAVVDDGVPSALAPSRSWDANRDGKISTQEFKGPAQLMQNMDLDGNGFLSGMELGKLDQKLSFDKVDDAVWAAPPDEKYHGVEHHVYFSRSMQTNVGYNIYLPDEYATSQTRYPVIYHLHGSGGNESSQIDLSEVYRRAITEGKMCPVILVFANGGKRSYYCDGANGKIMAETTIIRELIPHIDASYRTIPEKACRAVHGFSMGGFGALKLGSKYPELFSAVLSFGGGMASPGSLHMDFLRRIVGDDAVRLADNNPASLVVVNKSALAGMSYWLFTGTRDVAREDSTWAHEWLQSQGIAHRFEVSEEVGHTLKKHYTLFGDQIFDMLQNHFAASPAFSQTAH